jgi:ABC-type phosphate transport system substrate-binding protein
MKKIFKFIAAIVFILILASCSIHPNTPSGVQSGTPSVSSSASLSEAPSVSVSPKPVSTINNVPANLPDPGNWAPSLKMSAADYPQVDGSTATLPLAVYMRSKITGTPLSDSLAQTVFYTTGPSYDNLIYGQADILVVYEAPDEIKKEIQAEGTELLQKPIGMDALVFLINSGNKVGSLTKEQIVDIYTGKITNWKQVGGEDIDIIPYQRISNSGSQALMKKLVMKGTAMMEAPTSLQPGEMDELVDDIASYDNTSNALGYSVYYYIHNMYSVEGIKLLGVGGVNPDNDTISTGAYPYVSPFYAVIKANEPAGSPAHKLFDWLTGPEGSRTVGDAGYVPVK